MLSNASIAWDYHAGLVFVAHRAGRLVDADFGEFLADLKTRSGLHGAVIRASEGAPQPAHRAELQRWYQENAITGAVLTDSLLARGGVTALRWFGVRIAAFAPHELDAALRYVGVDPDEANDALRALGGVIARVDGSAASSRA
jgi:hypothetical protein